MAHFEKPNFPSKPESPWMQYKTNEEVRTGLLKLIQQVVELAGYSFKDKGYLITNMERILQEEGYPEDAAVSVTEDEQPGQWRIEIRAFSPIDQTTIYCESTQPITFGVV